LTTSPVTIGETVGRYCLERELGRGATSIVYLGRDVSAAAPVAIKVLRPELLSAISAERFLREIRLTSTLQHPSIVPVLDSGDSNGSLFCVMPYMDGGTLRERLRREKQLSISEVVEIGTAVARALHFAHERNIVHRDVKPENILFSGGQATLSDFGIARALIRATDESTTSTGIVRGTPAYMSPEQAAGDQDIDGRSDIFSLACVLYEALAGVPAFIGANSASVVAQRFSHSPRPVRVFREMVPEGLERALAKALAIAPSDRYRTAIEFADALTWTGSSNPDDAGQPLASIARKLKRVPRRRYLQWFAALLTTATLATAGAVVARQRMSSVRERGWQSRLAAG
jgi:serine/threonine-protein kinase